MRVVAIFDCDRWRSKDSMRLIAIADESNLRNMLQKIQEEHGYNDDDMETYIYIETFMLNEYE